MLQNSTATSWDLQTISYEPSVKVKLCLLFLLAACVMTSIKLARLWIAAPPFYLNRQVGNPAYLNRLESSKNSLTQWATLTLVVSGLFVTARLYDACVGLSYQKTFGIALLIYVIGDTLSGLILCFVVVLFILLMRWHLM